MKKLLITGFEPFGGETVNPSWEAVRLLPDEIGGYALSKLEIPVVFGEAADLVIATAATLSPDVILCVGQAGGRSAVTPELVGINLRHARIPDNRGNSPADEPIEKDGPHAYFSTLPVRQMADAVRTVGIPSEVSYSAGAYVCNDVLYTLLHRFEGTGTRVGFVHVPYTPEQGKEPSMPAHAVLAALTAIIEHLDA